MPPSADQPPDMGAWADDTTRETLHLIAEGITRLVGFDVAAVSVARDRECLQVLAVAGSEEARRTLDGTLVPIERMLAELEPAEDWGRFKFVAEDRRAAGSADWGWTPDLEPSEHPDAWRPQDLLVAPLYDHDDVLLGTLSIDCPADGRRPDPARRRMLEQYAAQAARALILAAERTRLAERVRLLSAARGIVRSVSSEAATVADLKQLRASLRASFRAHRVWVHAFEDGLEPPSGVTSGSGPTSARAGGTHRLPARLVASIEAVATESWSTQQVAVVGRRPGDAQRATPAVESDIGALADFMDEVGLGTAMLAPLGAGPECLGVLVLTRGPQDPAWSDLELDTALEIGHDLGRSLLHARVVTRERAAVRELRALDAYKSSLLMTLSHELKSPLAVMLGNLELLDGRQRHGRDGLADADDAETDDLLAAVGRGADRLVRVVESLLLLARVDDPHSNRNAVPVDLASVVEEVRALSALDDQHRLVLDVVDAGRVVAVGDPAELETLVGNLVGNAMKYSASDTTVNVSLSRPTSGEVLLTCADSGIGIADDDRVHLFEEFFRSDDGDVRRQAGTGLGLAIVDRVVARHGGRVEVESELGVGTTVRVTLPAAD